MDKKCEHDWQLDYPEDAGWMYCWVKCSKCDEFNVMKRSKYYEKKIQSTKKKEQEVVQENGISTEDK